MEQQDNMDKQDERSKLEEEADPSSVACDVCVGQKRKAEQSCLECVASYCEAHVELHNTLHGVKRHRLVEAKENLQERTCPHHGKLLEVFCRTDQQCICHLCITDSHRTHNVISIQLEVEEKKIQLENMQKDTTKRIHTLEKEEQELKKAVEAFKISADEAVVKNEELFTELIHSMEERQKKMKLLILAQKEAVIKEVEDLIDKIQQQITELKKRDAELEQLEQLSQESNVCFLQSACSISPLSKVICIPLLLNHPYSSFEPATEAVSELMRKLNLICQWHFITISERVKSTGIVSSPLPRTRQELLKYATKITLDSNTVHDNICLSVDDRLLTAVRESEYYIDHRDRFERRLQALCKEGLRGSPRYWEVKCGTRGTWVSIAVSYKSIRRTGRKAPLFGRCEKSWALRKYFSYYQFWHDNKDITIWNNSSKCSIIGVYLDHGAGVLAFYNVSENTSLIHKVQTKFTEPVYPGFGLSGAGSQIQLCDLD
ncbi:tripartite motif-containing protein 16-like [Hoplias malabaricus]|uniref:tripartite motif-containing protein 16-like n=1 Tax=Hoplias malabaricus TaxID=27720 RepID=UPI003461D345